MTSLSSSIGAWLLRARSAASETAARLARSPIWLLRARSAASETAARLTRSPIWFLRARSQVSETAARMARSPIGLPLLAALLAGLVLWVLGLVQPWQQGLRAAPALPGAQPGQRITAFFAQADLQNPIPQEPMAVAVLQGGDVLVADVGLARIHRFGPDGRLLRSYGANGGLRYPIGLAVGDGNRVWVADLWQQRLYRLDLETDQLAEVPPAEAGYQIPNGLAYRNGRLYLTDVGRHQVLVFDADGRPVGVIGEGKGREPGQLTYPNGVWVAEDGEVFVSDSDNARIQVFDGHGRLQRVLQPHRLLHPRGLVQDRHGRLHVVDTLAHDVAVLDPAGHVIARYGVAEGLMLPNGLAVRGSWIYVADRGNRRVVAWELGDE